MKWLALLCGVACGAPPALYLHVEAPLRVPETCDAAAVTVQRGSTTAFAQTFDLSAMHVEFPLTLLLEVGSEQDVGAPLEVTVSALKNGAPAEAWATSQQRVTLEASGLTSATISLFAP